MTVPASSEVPQEVKIGTKDILFPSGIDEHISKYIVTDGEKMTCTLCNRHLAPTTVTYHIFNPKHHHAWVCHEQPQPVAVDIKVQTDKPQKKYIFKPTEARGTPKKKARPAGARPATMKKAGSLPLTSVKRLRPIAPKPYVPITNEEKLNDLDHVIFGQPGLEKISIEKLKERRELIQKIGMKEWRALEEKRVKAWEAYARGDYSTRRVRSYRRRRKVPSKHKDTTQKAGQQTAGPTVDESQADNSGEAKAA